MRRYTRTAKSSIDAIRLFAPSVATLLVTLAHITVLQSYLGYSGRVRAG